MRFCGVFSFCSRYRDVLLMAAQVQHELHHERQESATVLGSGNYKNPGEPYFTLNWEYCSHEKRCKYGTSLPACQLAILPAWPLILSLCYQQHQLALREWFGQTMARVARRNLDLWERCLHRRLRRAGPVAWIRYQQRLVRVVDVLCRPRENI